MTHAHSRTAARRPFGRASIVAALCAAASALTAAPAHAENALEKLKRKLEAIQQPAAQPGQQPPAGAAGDKPSLQDGIRAEKEKLGGLTATPAEFRLPALPERLEAAGVRIGMPAEAAVPALRAHNAALRIATEQVQIGGWPKPAAFLLTARAPGSQAGLLSEEIHLRLALPPQPSLVTEIVRNTWYDEGKEPPVETVLAALRAKYGDPGAKMAGDGHGLTTIYLWRLDGQRVDPSAARCHDRGSSIKFSDDLEGDLAARLKGLERVAQLCGAFVAAGISTPVRNHGLVSTWWIRVSSEPFRAATLRSMIEHLRSLDAARRGTEVEKAKGVQVKI